MVVTTPIWIAWAFVAGVGLSQAVGVGGFASVGWSGLIAAIATYVLYPLALFFIVKRPGRLEPKG